MAAAGSLVAEVASQTLLTSRNLVRSCLMVLLVRLLWLYELLLLLQLLAFGCFLLAAAAAFATFVCQLLAPGCWFVVDGTQQRQPQQPWYQQPLPPPPPRK